MATEAQFDVVIRGGSTSVEDYRRAMAAPKSELPKLSAVQNTVVKKLGLPADEYRRGVLAEQFGESRLIEQGKKLGAMVQVLLDELGSGYEVDAIQAEMAKFRWLIRVVNAERVIVAEIPRDVAADALDSESGRAVGLLKKYLFTTLDGGPSPVRS
jgi:hypothetical protein